MAESIKDNLAAMKALAAKAKAENASPLQAPQSVVAQTRSHISDTTADHLKTIEIRKKPFPFAVYPIVTAHAAVLIVGVAALVNDCVADDSVMGDDSVANHIGTIDSHTEDFVNYSELEDFKKGYGSVWTAMQKETSRNDAERDYFVALNAILQKDEAKLLELTKKYTNVDFLPAYLVGAKTAEVKKIVAYAKNNGPEQAISRIMEEKETDQSDDWPYRAALLKGVAKKIKYRKELSQEVWDSCSISKDKNLFIDFPDTGQIAKRALVRLEDPSTAGQLDEVKGLDGEPWLNAYGQKCMLRETYARELEEANRCVFEKSKKEIALRHCYRSAQMQCVVRSSIKIPPLHKCSDDEEAGLLDKLARGVAWVKNGGKKEKRAAPPGLSLHQWGTPVDFAAQQPYLKECLPPYWTQLEGDPAHWDARQVTRPKEGNCTTVELRGGGTRPFCFYVEKGAEATSETLAEGEYARVPEGEIAMGDLMPVKATPEIVAMSEKIENKEFRHISVQELLDGAWHLFRYQADGKEAFCKVEAHNNHKIRGIIGFVRGRKSAETALYNQGCSTYRRK